MTEQITLSLPVEVLQRAQLLAQKSGRAVNDILAETIELSLRPLGAEGPDDPPMATWSDEGVLAATEAELAPTADQRLSGLLHRQQAGTLAAAEQPELQGLMEMYQRGLLRKARALREAIRRGLREPVQP